MLWVEEREQGFGNTCEVGLWMGMFQYGEELTGGVTCGRVPVTDLGF